MEVAVCRWFLAQEVEPGEVVCEAADLQKGLSAQQ